MTCRVWRSLAWLAGMLARSVLVAAAPAADHAQSVLLLFADPPHWRAAEHFAPARDPAALAVRRSAIAAARRAAFAAVEPPWPQRLQALLRRQAGVDADIECHAVLNACLVHLAAADAERAVASLRFARTAPGSGIVHLSTFPFVAPPVRMERASVVPQSPPPPSSARPSLALAIIDNGADVTQPLLAAALGHAHFQPGTPGQARDGHLLRSHGTAMLGIYASLARGSGLVASGQPQARFAALPNLRWDATLIARAGPEDARGQAALVRALAWLAAPTGARPFPDLLNYSQGNGRLCRPDDSSACAARTWSGVTRLLDRLTEEYALVVVKSAGNLGYGARTTTTMTIPGDTYNGITVGNMHAYDHARCAASAERESHAVYRNSSVAPAGGPRLLDLVAPGVRIATAGVDPTWCRVRCQRRDVGPCNFCRRLGRPDPADDGYWRTNSGSSPAAAVTGATAAGLLAQAGLRDPRLIKAVLINSAQTWTSNGSPHPPVRGDGRGCSGDTRGHRPYARGAHYDRSYGWGYLDPARAMAEAPLARLDAIAPASAVCYRTTLEPYDKLSLVWARRVGTTAGSDGRRSDSAATDPHWFRLSPLRLELYDAADRSLIARDWPPTPADNVLQIANADATGAPGTRTAIVRVATPVRQFDGLARQLEPYALASARPLARLAQCPRLQQDSAALPPQASNARSMRSKRRRMNSRDSS